MLIIEKLREDLKSSILSGNTSKSSNIRTIIGETQRLRDKNPDDATIEKILRTLLKLAESIPAKDNEWIAILKTYLPTQATEEDIIEFVKTIDFSKLKNKNAAIGMVVKHFGNRADGNIVKQVIENIN